MAETREEWLHSRLRDLMATGSDQLARGRVEAAADTFRTALQLLPADADPVLRAEVERRLADAGPARPETVAPPPEEDHSPAVATPVEAAASGVERAARNRPIPPPSFALLEPAEAEDTDKWLALLSVVIFVVFVVGPAVWPHPVPRLVYAQPLKDIKPEAVYRARLPLPAAASQVEPADADADIVYFAPSEATLPRVISRADGIYTKEALAAGFEGTVQMFVKINAAGRPYDPRVRQSPGYGLDDQALKAVMGWRFRPAEAGGKTVLASAFVDVHFRRP
jgi:TonB family protein